MRKFIVILVVLFLAATLPSRSQSRWAVSTNGVDWLQLATINAELSYNFATHWTVHVQGKYNPWTWKSSAPNEEHVQYRQAGVGVGLRYWFWQAYSGFFISPQVDWKAYNRGGLFNDETTYEGNLYYFTPSGGYSLMLNSRFNLDFGLGLGIGVNDYTKYACPKCGRVLDKGKKLYIEPNNVLVQLTMLF